MTTTQQLGNKNKLKACKIMRVIQQLQTNSNEVKRCIRLL